MAKKVLFLDRDGTLIHEPEDMQVDGLDKYSFIPDVIYYLRKIADELGYLLVMVTNQDGLGTEAFPEDNFWPVQNHMVDVFASQGVHFDEICIDKTYAHENVPTRKPGIGLIGKYIHGDYDLARSFMVGDRYTDIQFARNFGGRGILIGRSLDTEDDDKLDLEGLKDTLALKTSSWKEIYEFLRGWGRRSSVHRKTAETDISVELNLDGSGASAISTGLSFFDHMLDQLAKHSGCDITINARGDLQVDEHHTMEDTALALGEAFKKALGDKKGVQRYGFMLPMDDVLAQAAVDFGGRPWLVWEVRFNREKIGDVPTEMFMHFFKSFSDASASNINLKAEGDNEHHKIEAVFKAFARAVGMAVMRTGGGLPSTKGSL